MSGNLSIDTVKESEEKILRGINRGFYRIDPRAKLILLMLVIVLNIGLAIPRLSLALLAVGLIALIWTAPFSRLTAAFFVAPLISTIVIIIGFAFGFGSDTMFSIGRFPVSREGLMAGVAVAVRIYCDVTWLALTFLTESFSGILAAFRWFRMPAILVDTLSLMYRYAFLLHAEFNRMYIAAQARGGKSGYVNTITSLGSIISQVFIRAYDRSERIYSAMISRGGE